MWVDVAARALIMQVDSGSVVGWPGDNCDWRCATRLAVVDQRRYMSLHSREVEHFSSEGNAVTGNPGSDRLCRRESRFLGTVKRWDGHLEYCLILFSPVGEESAHQGGELSGDPETIPVMFRKTSRVCGTEDIRFAVTRKRSLPVSCSAMASPMI